MAAESLKQEKGKEWTETKEELRKAKGTLTEKGAQAASEGRSQLCSGLDAIAESIHQSAERLYAENNFLAQPLQSVGNAVSDVSRKMRDKDFNQVLEQTRSIVRDHPAVVLGSLFVGGMALSRFMKSAQGGRDRWDWDPRTLDREEMR